MISVRGYTSDDYEEVKRLYQDLNTFGGQFDADRDSPERMSEQLGRNKDRILVAEEDGIIVGTVSILSDKRFAWLVRFAVSSEHEKEISKLLFHKASEILKGQGHTQVLVYAPEGQHTFAKRYENLGFVEGQQSYTSYWRQLQ